MFAESGNKDMKDMMNESALKEKYKLLINAVANEPLIEAVPSLNGLNLEILESKPNGGIYYGTGLTTPRAMGVGLPFDVLGMILVAEKLKRTTGLKSVYHHIADTHAKTNEWIDPDQVDKRAKVVKEVLERVAQNLGLGGFHVVLSSEFDKSSEYQELVNFFNSKSEEHEYVRREMADMEWYRQRHDVTMKMGWIIQASETIMGFDERLFDREYVRINGKQLSFLYTKPGRTFDKPRPKASPYIQIKDESRLLLESGENVARKINDAIAAFGDPHLGGAIKHLENIVRLYEKLFENLGKIPLVEKLQRIIDKVTV